MCVVWVSVLSVVWAVICCQGSYFNGIYTKLTLQEDHVASQSERAVCGGPRTPWAYSVLPTLVGGHHYNTTLRSLVVGETWLLRLVARRCESQNARPLKCILAGLTMWLSKIPSLEVLCVYYISLQYQEQVLALDFVCPILSKTGTDGSASQQTLYIVLTHHYRVSDSARILTYPPFGVSRSKNQFIPISAGTFRSGRSRGSSTAAVWKALPTASAVLPVLDHSCWTQFLGEVDLCSTNCTASWCHRLCSIPNWVFQAHLRASHHRVPFLCFEWNLWW